LGEHEQKLSNSKKEIKSMIEKANDESEKNVIKTNEDFHILMENKKKNVEQKINQMKDQALKDIRNISVKIAITSVERLLKNSLDKSKLDKLYSSSIEETKVALNKKSS
jgi:F-type H+-transporting ATPase subunit b